MSPFSEAGLCGLVILENFSWIVPVASVLLLH